MKPVVHHLRVFGCVAHTHILEVKRKKLDDKSIGVSEESKAYRMYDSVGKRIVVSWNWGRDAEAVKLDVSKWNEDEEVNEEDQGIEEEESSKDNSGSDSSSSEPIDEEVREVRRTRRAPPYLRDYVSGEGLSEEELHNMAMFAADLTNFEEACREAKWRATMGQEIQSIEKNDTWELCDLPDGAKTIGVEWIFKTKLNENGDIDNCKARLVAKEYAQEYGVDYTKVFAPVARWDTIRMVLALAAQKGWKVYQLDVKSAFLHGELEGGKKGILIHRRECEFWG